MAHVLEHGQDDAATAARLSQRDPTVIADLYARFADHLHRVARPITGSAADADDAVQEVFSLLWSHPERFDPSRGAIGTFLTMMVRGRSRDLVRSERARRARNDKAHRRGIDRDRGAVVEDEMDHVYLRDTVRAAMAHLPQRQRQAIQLAYFSHLTYREVAVVLGLPEGTVKSHIRLGLRRLARLTAFEPPVSSPPREPHLRATAGSCG